MSTQQIQDYNKRRTQSMNSVNPRYVLFVDDWLVSKHYENSLLCLCCFRIVLCNYIAQNAINAAEKGDFSVVRKTLQVLENPFSDIEGGELSQSNRLSGWGVG